MKIKRTFSHKLEFDISFFYTHSKSHNKFMLI